MIITTRHTTALGEIVLEEAHTVIGIHVGPLGGAMVYRRPVSVTYRGSTTPIPDPMPFVRLLGLVVFTISLIARRRTR